MKRGLVVAALSILFASAAYGQVADDQHKTGKAATASSGEAARVQQSRDLPPGKAMALSVHQARAMLTNAHH